MQQVFCSGCGATLRLRDEYQGRRVKCPACGTALIAAVAGTEPRLQRVSVPTAGPVWSPDQPRDHDPLFEIESTPTPPPIFSDPRSVGGGAAHPLGSATTSAVAATSGLVGAGSLRPLPSYLAPPTAKDAVPAARGRRPAAVASPRPKIPIAVSPLAIATASAGLVLVVGAGAWVWAGLAAKAMFIPPLLVVIGLIVICRALWVTSE